MRTLIPALLSAAILAIAAALLLTIAAEASEAEEAQELVARLVELRQVEDAAGLMEALGQLPDVYEKIESASLRAKLRREMGRILRDESLGDARVSAVGALVAINDPKVAWKELSKGVPSPKVEEASALDLAIVRATGQLAQKAGIGVLLDLVTKATDNKLARAAAVALAGFRDDRRNRVKVLEELLALGKRIRPGVSPGKTVSPVAQKRWEIVGPGIVAGLNGLTRQTVSSFEEWEAFYKEFKRQPKDLFLED